MASNQSSNTQNLNINVCVIGGGIAGLSASVFLSKNGLNVTLIESSPKFGGRAYSFFDKNINQYIDNGKHILASWYVNTFEFLKIIGTYDKLKFRDRLRIKFIDSDSKQYEFKCSKLPPPYHLIWGLFRYKALKISDKLAVLRLIKYIRSNILPINKLSKISISGLFVLTKQTERTINYFWKPFIVAVFNARPDETNALDFIRMIKKGFLEKNSSNLVFPRTDLNSLYVNSSIEYLKKNNTCIMESSKINKVMTEENRVKKLILDSGKEIDFDFLIIAVPFSELKYILGEEFYNDEYSQLDNLHWSPIVNIHHIFERKNEMNIIDFDFAGVLNSTIQWIFKITDDRICLVISRADELIGKDKDEIIEMSKKELIKCLPKFKDVKFKYSRVVKEKRATFLPDLNSLSFRPGNKTKFDNLFIAGDWTDTGYPATIESAVTSAKNCVNEIMKQRDRQV